MHYIDYLSTKMTSNGKTLNYKIADLVESYNFSYKVYRHPSSCSYNFFEHKLKTEISI
jgi:hypothetical protein